MAFNSDQKICLNGWWDFFPRDAESGDRGIPEDGWHKKQYLTPSFWNKLTDGVRRRNEKYFKSQPDLFKKPGALTSDMEFLFDAFDYPDSWSATRSAWIRRSVHLPQTRPEERWFLEFEAVEPQSTLFVNGRNLGSHIHPSLPFTRDITDVMEAGANEIAILIEDYARDANGRIKTPVGSWNVENQCGIWQDVYLLRRGMVRVEDVTIRTSLREHRIDIEWIFANAGDKARTVTVRPSLHAWQPATRAAEEHACLSLKPFEVTVPAGGNITHTLQAAWPDDVRLWQPESPDLYVLKTDLAGQETHCERFGFREIWIEGCDLMLNGYPLHLFSDWGHKLTPYCYTESWIRQWFGMMRDANLNHSRLHTHPHPRLIMDMADEEGILITGETGLHGSGGALAADDPAFWEAADDHVRRFVRRDKNHPCIILWSVENEARWNPHKTRMLEDNLPRLRKLFNDLDPTRPAYHEGDSSLWNEKTQPIVSRHYYKTCAGAGWWDQTRPLHSGEISLYHYAGPNNTAHLAGDRAWSSFQALDEAAARDTALIVEAGRALGVCCLAPWNLSCLENLRMESRHIRLGYADPTAPGMKPLQAPPHSSEFAFWNPAEKGYTPNWSFAIQKHAFRPFAVLDLSMRRGYFNNAPMQRRLVAVNDTAGAVRGTISGALLDAAGNREIVTAHTQLTVKRGGRAEFEVELNLACLPPGRYLWRGQFVEAGTGAVLDTWLRPLTLCARNATDLPDTQIMVFGPGSLRQTLVDMGLAPTYIESLERLRPETGKLLVLEQNTVAAGSDQNRRIRKYCRAGGRVLVMEQETSLFKGLPLEDKPLQTQFFRAASHPVLNGLSEEDMSFWGDTPYPAQGGDALVINRAYRKDDARQALFVMDGDEGSFGSGGLNYAGLIEIREGAGLILACQLKITTRAHAIPAAYNLLANMLTRLAGFSPATTPGPIQVDGANLASGRIAELALDARAGRDVIVHNAGRHALAAFGRELGVELRIAELEEPVYQAVRVADDPVLAGVSNEDTCGIETWAYCSSGSRNHALEGNLIEPLPGVQPLLETPTKNILAEFFVHGGRSEPLRAHTMSRFLFDYSKPRAIVLARVCAGAGQVLFNQFSVTADGQSGVRLTRLANRLAANLGGVPDNSLLDGETVPELQTPSCGYPESIHILKQPVTDTLRDQLIDCTHYCPESFDHSSVFSVADWQHCVECPDGTLSAAGLQPQQTIGAYFRLHSAVQRNDSTSNLGAPNPEAFTFLDLQGEGKVELIVNGAPHSQVNLEAGAVISDIALEQGNNHVLIFWQPVARESRLRLLWRNIEHKPESGFRFR